MEDQAMYQAPINWESSLIQSPKKRRKLINNNEDANHANFHDVSPTSFTCCKRFLPINSSNFIYESEEYKSKGETLYVPLRESVLVNVQNIEQFSFKQGSFFIGDESSRFSKVVQGVALHLWRYSDTQQKLYISRSFVFTNIQVFNDIKKILDFM
ncbi:uncharacterized protein LOC116303905 [Actinia tenebrosa]|uniref:Uncharacterized protein LOC116303905 n=1 Tax=Actinia tenebrosa TaxID=6105 RepID=A0A6P8IR84_ACTTE|nr:uncharacterized protein LOC116303905 [Actinia tenebrosa]